MFASRRYQKVSQHADSDEDEVTLYAHASTSVNDRDFGGGAYDHSRDLELPKLKVQQLRVRRYSRSRIHSLFASALFFTVLCLVLILAVALIVYGSQYGKMKPELPSEHETSVLTAIAPTPLLPAEVTDESPTVSSEPTSVTRPESKPETIASSPPEGTTSSPPETTTSSPPEGTTSSPPETTASSPPEGTTSSPPETTTSSPPEGTTSSPPEGTTPSPPETTASSPPEGTTSSPPEGTTSSPPETTASSPPEGTTSSPPEGTTSSPPETTTSSPPETTASSPPEGTTSSPPETTASSPPEGTTSSPPETTTSSPPEGTTSSPPETTASSPPEGTTSSPPETTTSSPPEGTTSSPPEGTTSTEDVKPKPPEGITAPTPTPSEGVTETNLTANPPQDTTISWEREFYPASTECTIQLYDMNRDGVLDVLTVDGYTPCTSIIMAMDGKSGRIVWEKTVEFAAFAVVCELDINSDGVTDCFAAGRNGGFVALDGRDGSVLWVVDSSIVFLHYNFYFPLIVDDLDLDGMQDIINVHGGDTNYDPDQIERSPAFLVAISGRTGQKLMAPILSPDGRESYMSPVLFSFPDEAEVILLGTGGETIPGSLWGVTLNSIRERVFDYVLTSSEYDNYEVSTVHVNHFCEGDLNDTEVEALRPVFDHTAFDLSASVSDVPPFSSCPLWGELRSLWNCYNVCLYELLRTEEKGVILPPVIIEMTGDEREDLIVSTFDGHTIVLDGRNGRVVWDKHFPGSESYSLPSPLYYNHDDTPDLLIRVNMGNWSEYEYSYLPILDGRDGEVLWTLNTSRATMMSAVSLTASSHGEDGMVFVAVGPDLDSYGSGVESGAASGNLEPESDQNTEGTDRQQSEAANIKGSSTSRQERNVDGMGEEMSNHDSSFAKRPSHCHSSFDGPTCWREALHTRERKHGDENDGEEEEEEEDGGKKQDLDLGSFHIVRDPPGVWDSTEEDQFPDPRTNLDEFLLYCGYSREQLTAHLFFLTPELASTHTLRPLTSHEPYMFFPSRGKRHGVLHSHGGGPQGGVNIAAELKEFRCRHVEYLGFLPVTLAIGDLNGDGRVEVAYAINWEGRFLESGVIPPKLLVGVFTLEARVGEVYGEGVVDFSRFLPMEQQPWTRYMGARGDNVFRVRGREHMKR